MDIEQYTRLWSEGKVANPSGASFWDNRADEFNKLVSRGTPDQRIGKIVEFMFSNNLLSKDSSVLDIGCGPGGFAVEFAKISREVTGLDISAKMLDYAQKNAAVANLPNVSFKNLNWDEVNLEEYGWEKRFDLVAAINSPGIHDQITLEKMIAASRGYCFLSNFVDRSDSVQDIIRTEVLQIKDPKFYVNTVYCIFNILWLIGYYPYITYVDTDREHVRSLEEACIYYGTLFEAVNNSDDQKYILIRNYLEKISQNGFVHERVRTKTAWIYWKA
ncbi:class I SAM-dependent methyltransferase [Desulfosporosinus youngiae]|uniref:Methylase involved in ubiquinone/menaquinone biosynthesis n=1 Tax=Desulfosporosinus youngiae DSM 17734 TaxID=768710 RepID=H5Y683_9FIRM|nr:class I SAM-dependent methyltransferase [Desulfosporosinus youngiae]EHQ91093.1 methylase involved in ubiquinone/menaquinone biosynthesis [Desulfosporosinus youngiae DSM 17734]